MNEVWILAVGSGLVLSFLGGKWWAGKKNEREERPARVELRVGNTDLINSSLLRSLELGQKRLESLLFRAEEVEQNLRRLLIQADVGRADQYSTAALLIAEGKKVEQVARTLKLPSAQVRLIQELRQEMEKNRKAAPDSRLTKESQPKERGENGADLQEKIAGGHAGGQNGTANAFAHENGSLPL